MTGSTMLLNRQQRSGVGGRAPPLMLLQARHSPRESAGSHQRAISPTRARSRPPSECGEHQGTPRARWPAWSARSRAATARRCSRPVRFLANRLVAGNEPSAVRDVARPPAAHDRAAQVGPDTTPRRKPSAPRPEPVPAGQQDDRARRATPPRPRRRLSFRNWEADTPDVAAMTVRYPPERMQTSGSTVGLAVSLEGARRARAGRASEEDG